MLIRDEADRIRALVDRMEVFGEKPVERRAVNIHRVLEHVRLLAQSGLRRRHPVSEAYDPSLPPVWGNRDQLVQVVLNLVKNAAEAIAGDPALRRGRRDRADHRLTSTGCASPWPAARTGCICRSWSPSATTGRASRTTSGRICSRPSSAASRAGSGLGLALVAKIVGDHGGLIEVDSRPGRTEFRLACR